jgi:hypothetical protein
VQTEPDLGGVAEKADKDKEEKVNRRTSPATHFFIWRRIE